MKRKWRKKMGQGRLYVEDVLLFSGTWRVRNCFVVVFLKCIWYWTSLNVLSWSTWPQNINLIHLKGTYEECWMLNWTEVETSDSNRHQSSYEGFFWLESKHLSSKGPDPLCACNVTAFIHNTTALALLLAHCPVQEMVLDRDGLSLWHTHIFASLSHIIICNRLWWSKLICKNSRCWLSWFRRSHVFSGGHHLFLNLHFSLSSSSIGTQGYNSTGCSHDNFQIDCWWFYSQQQVEILNTLMDTGTIWVKLKSPIDKSGQVTLVVLWNSISWEIILLFL